MPTKLSVLDSPVFSSAAVSAAAPADDDASPASLLSESPSGPWVVTRTTFSCFVEAPTYQHRCVSDTMHSNMGVERYLFQMLPDCQDIARHHVLREQAHFLGPIEFRVPKTASISFRAHFLINIYQRLPFEQMITGVRSL